jgi:GNAT superfamily N-acetyltransferase
VNDTRDSSRLVRGSDPRSDVPYVAGRYPTELETDIVVHTGATLHMRPIRSDDATKLIAFHHHLSFDSIYRRYFSIHPELSPAEVAHLTEVDYVDRLALVIEDGDELVAVGRYDRYPSTSTAEVAFVVRDDYQHLGLGHRLLEGLADAARARGITTLSAETLFENHDMMSVFRHSGFPMTTSSSRGEIDVSLSIEPITTQGAARDTPYE